MNRQGIFEAWKKRRVQIKIRRDFSAEVMSRLRENPPTCEMPGRTPAFLTQVAGWPWAKAALITLGVSLGLARILLMLQLILFA